MRFGTWVNVINVYLHFNFLLVHHELIRSFTLGCSDMTLKKVNRKWSSVNRKYQYLHYFHLKSTRTSSIWKQCVVRFKCNQKWNFVNRKYLFIYIMLRNSKCIFLISANSSIIWHLKPKVNIFHSQFVMKWTLITMVITAILRMCLSLASLLLFSDCRWLISVMFILLILEDMSVTIVAHILYFV